MIRPILVEPRKDFNLHVKYSDETEGEFDCLKLVSSDKYSKLKNWKEFKKVHIHPKSFDICWNDDLSICKNAVYKIITLKNLAKSIRIDPHLT
jgi:hypothetical protein